MFLMFLTCISNSIRIGYYLLFDQYTYFLYTILDHKNLKFQHLFEEIAIDFTCNLTARFSKFTLNIEIYKEFVEFLSKLVWKETLFLF